MKNAGVLIEYFNPFNYNMYFLLGCVPILKKEIYCRLELKMKFDH